MNESFRLDGRLVELYQTNPIVHAAIHRYMQGEMSYEDTLVSIIVDLGVANDKLKAKLIESVENSTHTPINLDLLSRIRNQGK